MLARFRVLSVLCLLPALCVGQNPTNGGPVYPDSDTPKSAPVQPAPNAPPNTAPAAPLPVKHSPEGFPVLEDGTPIRLSLSRTLSSADVRTGDRVDFKVVEPIVLDGITVVPQGGIAWGRVAEAQHKRRMTRGGKLAIEITEVKLANSDKAKLRAVREAKGGGHTGVMGGAMVGTAIVFWPIAPVWLLMHGKEAKIPAGTEITAYVNGDVVYPEAPRTPAPATAAPVAPAPASAAPAAEAPPPGTAAPEPGAPEAGTPEGEPGQSAEPGYAPDAAAPEAAPGSTEISFTSTPDGADIELDGAFMGSTPSTIGVPGGEHTVRFSKRGYQPYEKRLHTAGGTIRLHADLQAVQ